MPGIRFEEAMDGYLGENIRDFRDGEDYGIRHDDRIRFDVRVEMDSVDDFVRVSAHEARLRGRFYCSSIGGDRGMAIKKGRFNLFDIDPASGHRRMRYAFNFKGPDGAPFFFSGFKDIFNDRAVDMVEDMTTLFVRIHRGRDETGGLYGSGVMYFRVTDMASIYRMLSTAEVTGASNTLEKYAAIARFAGFFTAETLRTYAPGPRFLYSTRYENLILSGRLKVRGDDAERDFFLFSGEHGAGFPWGDGETMSDLALLVADGRGGYLRYGVTRRSLKGLRVELDNNRYAYTGELYRMVDGAEVSFSEIDAFRPGGGIARVRARISLTLDAARYDRGVDVSFKPIEDLAGLVPDEFEDAVRGYLTGFPLLGYFTRPFAVRVTGGSIRIEEDGGVTAFSVVPESTFGEGEQGEINSTKEPTLYYNYLCAIDPGRERTHLDITSGTLRNEREQYLKDSLDKAVGEVIKRDARKSLVFGDSITDDPAGPGRVKEVLLTLVNDHYPTGVFLRRVVEVEKGGETLLGLEEYMDAINRAPINSEEESTVAVCTYGDVDSWDGRAPSDAEVLSVYDSPEKFDVLDRAMEGAAFFPALERALAASGKAREEFSIIIKPNFMFFYSTRDKSTYTDPALVEHLVDRIHERGFRNIKVAEARSTLSVFFENRDVRSVARHIGFTEGGKYRVVDLSEDLEPWDYGGALGAHSVNREWREADFRVSFAKLKTHSYAYYTLTIKNIYGALPEEFKFKAYHCDMGDIYEPTIDYLRAFPVHFGFVDGVVGADGPFGIFADPCPQLTRTIIAGEDLVAVDWVGASKMGLDPMLSRYMQEAVKAFGKPRIRVDGDDRLFRFWANIPRIASQGSHMLDRHYTFGYGVYYVMSEMDPAFPPRPSESAFLNQLRLSAADLREIFFKNPTKPPSVLHEAVNRIIFRLWQ